MQAFLGLFVFSVLLATGASRQCDICAGDGKTCSGKADCPANMDTCMSILTEMTLGQSTVYTIAKSCANKALCTAELDKVKTQLAGRKVTVECHNKAPSSAGSLLLALSGLLLLKILV